MIIRKFSLTFVNAKHLIMDFKTNLAQDNIAVVRQQIQRRFPNAAIKLELETTGKVLHLHGLPEDSEHASQVESAIKESGFEGSWLTRGFENK